MRNKSILFLFILSQFLFLTYCLRPDSLFSQNVKKSYILYSIEEQDVPVLDGVLDDRVWEFAPADSLLKGGDPADYSGVWTAFDDFLVVWQAAWCDESNKIYVAVRIVDDIRGEFDNEVSDPFYLPAEDESIEFCTDGNADGGNYWPLFGPAQYWRVTQRNQRDLEHFPRNDLYPAPYTGDAFETAVQTGDRGNWTCEAVFTIYNDFPHEIHDLILGDQIGWDIWANDSDNDHNNGDYYYMDHQTGWQYSGPVWKDAGFCGSLVLAACSLLPDLNVIKPNDFEQIQEGTIYDIEWRSTGGAGDDVSIHLYDGEEFVLNIATQTANNGLFKWQVPYGLAGKNRYRIRIRSFQDPQIGDYSDAYFEIIAGDSLKIRYPNEPGLIFYSDEVVDIRWTGSSAIDSVRIEWIQGDDTFLVNAATPNDGSYLWPVNDSMIPETDYILKISSVQDNQIFDYSDYPVGFYGFSNICVTVPQTMNLHPCYPNPFNPATTILYSVSRSSHVRVTIYNVLGKVVRTLVDKDQAVGEYQVQWNGRDNAGQWVSSGIFLVRMRAGDFVMQQKVMFLR